MGRTTVRVLDDSRPVAWAVRRLQTAAHAHPGGDRSESVTSARDSAAGRDSATAERRVGDLVPTGYAAYARVLHPVVGDSTETTWAAVARRQGVPMTSLTAWSALAAAGLGDPVPGTLAPEELAALCDVLAEHTATADECTFALVEGWPGLGSPAPAPRVSAGPNDAGAWRLPLVWSGGRRHALVAGPLSAAVPLSFSDAPGRWWEQSPTVMWPQDRAWWVTTAPGRRCTLVGGSVALVEDLMAVSALEAWPVGVGDRLPGTD